MTEDEYQKLRPQLNSERANISIEDLKNQEPRTLLYGYTVDRKTHHVYIENGEIHLFVYWPSGLLPTPTSTHLHSTHRKQRLALGSLIPNKRLYPEACDAEFCELLRQRDFYLPFTKWDDHREQQQYHGKRFSVVNQWLCDQSASHDESCCSRAH